MELKSNAHTTSSSSSGSSSENPRTVDRPFCIINLFNGEKYGGPCENLLPQDPASVFRPLENPILYSFLIDTHTQKIED